MEVIAHEINAYDVVALQEVCYYVAVDCDGMPMHIVEPWL